MLLNILIMYDDPNYQFHKSIYTSDPHSSTVLNIDFLGRVSMAEQLC